MAVETIDSIKRRMIKNASKMWGYSDVQDINSFDPVLGLMMGAVAEELYNISRETRRADARVIDKLLEVIFSQNLFSHFPAHAVVFARPLQPRVKINEFYQFYSQKEIHGANSREGAGTKKNIWFTPVGRSRLFKSEVKYLVAGKYVYEIQERFKEILEEAPRSAYGNTSFLLGVKTDPLINDLDGFSLFFTFKNLFETDRFYHLLASANWTVNGKKVHFKSGTERDSADSADSLSLLLKKNSDISYKISNYIYDFYEKYFMTLSGDNLQIENFKGSEGLPSLFRDFFGSRMPDLLKDDIIWIEIDFRQAVSDEEINDLVIATNCFPVINRELNEYTHSVSKGTNVIPLLTDDLFLNVLRVSNSKDEVYHPLSSIENGDESGKTYMLRQGGIARFDSRDARESISHLIDLVRDESAAFSIKGADLISSELKQLDQILSRLRQRINVSGIANDINSYLVVESDAHYDKINVQFWSVAGELANNFRPGTRLTSYRGIDLDDGSLTFFTQSAGGRQKLSKEDKLNTFRRALLSKGRIVTAEDIKALCFEIFGSVLKQAEVKKGVELGYSPEKGMTRTLDVHLHLNETHGLSDDELRNKTGSLKTRLKQESINLLPYRVFVK